jgi:hypothetical protein
MNRGGSNAVSSACRNKKTAAERSAAALQKI